MREEFLIQKPLDLSL